MVRNFRSVSPERAMRASYDQFRPDDLMDTTMSAGEFRTVAQVQGDKSNAYGPGYGTPSRNGTAGFADFDLQNTNGNPVEGVARYAVYRDSQKDDLVATSDKFPLAVLRSDVSEDKTDKTMVPAKSPVAGEDGYLTLEVKARPASDGDTVSPSNSAVNIGMPYAEYKR